MRLGQLARKHDIPVQEILSYLEQQTGEKFHANAKLYDAIESKIFEHFDIQINEPIVQEPIEEAVTEVAEEKATEEPEVERVETAADDIASVEGDLEITKEEQLIEDVGAAPSPEIIKPNEDEIIQTDKLLEMLASEEGPKDLEKIKLIKASKKELAGLKVLGKVDLPEPKKKTETEKKAEQQNGHQRRNRPQLSDEEKEKRRLEAKRKQEAFEAKKEKQRKEQEARKLKELKASHYQQKLQKPEVKKKKQSTSQTSGPAEHKMDEPTKSQPKTWLGKWWRWMNT